MLDDGAAERSSEIAREHAAVALDDDVEIAPSRRGAAPQIADEPADQVRAAILLLGDAADRLEQLLDLSRQATGDAAGRRGVGEPDAGGAAADGARGASRASYHDERRAGREQAADLRLARRRVDAGQRTRELRRPERAETERRRADEVVPQHVRRAGRDHAGVPLAREHERLGHADAGGRRRDRDVDEVGRRKTDLGVHVSPLCHAHARGWKRRYICSRVADGRCV